MSIKILLTGGRAPATLDLARQLHAAGYELYMAECERWHLCRTSNVFRAQWLVARPNPDAQQFVQDILQLCLHHQIQLIIPTCEETFHLAQAKMIFEQHGVTLFTSDLATLDLLHHKFSFIQFVRQFALPHPRSFFVTNEQQLQQAREQLAERCVIKPAYSRFNTDVYVLQLTDSLPSILISAEHPWVVQQYISGQQLCTYSVAQKGKIVAHGCYPTQFAVRGGATIHFEPIEQRELAQFVEHVVAALSFTGQIAFDFIVQPDGQWFPIECNPRATSGVHLFRGEEQFAHHVVDPSLVSDERTIYVEPPVARTYQLTAAMLLYSWGKRRFFQSLWRARDVIWDSNDWRPAFDQLVILGVMMWRRWRTGMSLTQLTTVDIEWSGKR